MDTESISILARGDLEYRENYKKAELRRGDNNHGE